MKGNMYIWIALILSVNLNYYACDDNCPKVVNNVDDGDGAEYNTKERFDNVRKGSPDTLTTRFVHHYHKTGDGEEYEYSLKFCGVNNSIAVKQVDKEGKTRIISKHDGASVLIGAEDWLFVQYKHGEKYGNHCYGKPKQSWISIRCEDGGEKPSLKVIEEARFNNHDKSKHPDTICYFLFEYNHPAACSPHKKSLSGGAVFMIIILVFFSSYLVLGFIYQRFILRATGLEQIPHYSFWRKLGNLSADGCDFVCRTKPPPNTYKGISNDLDLESSDDDRDGLLPM